MSPSGSLVRVVLLAAACAALSGCVSLFPKSKPAELYRFGAVEAADSAAPAAASAPQPGATAISEGAIQFDPASSSDRLLTMTGKDAAYVADARWVSPASALFEEALARTFEQTPGAPRLEPRFGLLRAPLLLSLDVQNFEARYDQGAGAPPLVLVKIRAMLIRTENRSVAGERTFTTTVRASDNRMGPIVEAYDSAVQKSLADLVAWCSGVAGARP